MRTLAPIVPEFELLEILPEVRVFDPAIGVTHWLAQVIEETFGRTDSAAGINEAFDKLDTGHPCSKLLQHTVGIFTARFGYCAGSSLIVDDRAQDVPPGRAD